MPYLDNVHIHCYSYFFYVITARIISFANDDVWKQMVGVHHGYLKKGTRFFTYLIGLVWIHSEELVKTAAASAFILCDFSHP